MSNEQNDQTISGNTDDKDLQTQTSAGQAEPAVTANSATTEPDVRESLVKQLMQAPVEETHEETAEPEKPEEVEDTDPLESVDDTKTPVAEETKAVEAESPVDDDKRLSERTRKRIAELHSKAAFGDLITQTLNKARIAPEEFSRWTNLAARLKNGDRTAVNELVATAKAFGYVEPTREAPAKTKTIDDVAEEVYARDFAADVDGLNISEPLARKQARKLAELELKSQPTQAPVRETPPPQQQAPTQSADPIREEALRTISAREVEYRSKVKGYTEIEATVVKRLRAEYGTRNPIEWVGGYNAIVREELRKAAPVQAVKAPLQAVAGTQLRPKTTVASAPVNNQDPRAQLVKDLVSGKFAR